MADGGRCVDVPAFTIYSRPYTSSPPPLSEASSSSMQVEPSPNLRQEASLSFQVKPPSPPLSLQLKAPAASASVQEDEEMEQCAHDEEMEQCAVEEAMEQCANEEEMEQSDHEEAMEQCDNEEPVMPCAASLDPQVQRELPMVKLVKPLEMIVRGEVKSFGRVDVPGLGLRFLTYEIIIAIYGNTHKSAGNIFRDLSDDKKNEVMGLCLTENPFFFGSILGP